MPGEVVVIVNANARRFVEAPSLVVDLERLVAGRAILHVTRSRRELFQAAEDARAHDASTVILCGGDGSWSLGATAVEQAFAGRALPILALAPGGTVGTAARALGLAVSGGPGRARTFATIARIVHAACSGNAPVLEHPMLAIDALPGGRRLAFIFGAGLVASFFELYDTRGAEAARAAAQRGEIEVDAPSSGAGSMAAAKIVARVFVESFVGGAYARRVLEPVRCDVAIEGTRLPWDASSLVVSSVLPDLGLGMRVTHRGAEDADRPHFVVSGLRPRSLGPRMFRVLRGVPIGGPPEPHFDGLASTLDLSYPDGPGPFVVDGDLRMARSLRVSGGPRIRFLRSG